MTSSTFTWATVTQVAPLRIRLDGDAAALLLTPDTLVDPAALAVSSRVRVELADRRVIVHGLAGAMAATTSRRGLVELATNAETAALADATRAVTPAGLAATVARITSLEDRPQGRVPASVTVAGGGSASAAADGTVTFTNVSSVSLIDIFDGLGSDLYELVVAGQTNAGAVVAQRLRGAGGDYSAAAHVYAGMFTQLSTGPGRSTGTTATYFGFCVPTTAGVGAAFVGRWIISRPNRAETTFLLGDAISGPNGDRYVWHEGANAGGNVAYPSWTILCSAGTMTGTVKVRKVG